MLLPVFSALLWGDPTHLDSDFKANSVAIACFAIELWHPDDLFQHASLVVEGNVTRVVEFAHSPDNSEGSDQRTIYQFRVEKTLKGYCPPKIKLRQRGGPLAWVMQTPFGTARGRGMRFTNIPPYVVGSRYRLYLHQPEPSPEDQQRGYFLGASGSTWGRIGDIDEYIPISPTYGRVRL